jgi:hypothetical protein
MKELEESSKLSLDEFRQLKYENGELKKIQETILHRLFLSYSE